ncbi:site-specific DNA-methyltransferase [Pedobacter yulinensis]|uniref:site-specific DNA-methyltransferase (adenine-specific) n=1 Tax=Pedobacter yulinensis TaxID=2126353 RepID=A0A2T3HL90_9SPHI|nr:site-specific DNA-methyltransferase [Pedobacter yulinensis]PST83186.1 site-specific DNA-methyltransferase [Pedobacter yulinensis]
MANKSHFNAGHIAMNTLKKNGVAHSSQIETKMPEKTYHGLFTKDAVEFLKQMPDSSVQLVLIDPPYNIDLAHWDTFENYLDWAKQWLDEIYRILTDTGNCVIFGGFQYQDLKKGDLLEIMHYTRHNTDLRFTNLVIWYYKNGMSAHRFFANRHEEAIWLSKTKNYFFDLDSVRVPYDEESKKTALKDKRLLPESIEKGKNPTNVWEIGRLNGNSVERVGHPTQKPLELIRRFVKGLSYPGSLVLDFFGGSGTTGRICIEESRNSILVDNDPAMLDYFKKHRQSMNGNIFSAPYEIKVSPNLDEFLGIVKNEVEIEC